mmetsp:Transcript_28460/g.55733  ORF Transcript_28460/g.55733 Transcript_28460/m.55733 type:complete len:123 (-) Transcript_28460:162-530(-)
MEEGKETSQVTDDLTAEANGRMSERKKDGKKEEKVRRRTDKILSSILPSWHTTTISGSIYIRGYTGWNCADEESREKPSNRSPSEQRERTQRESPAWTLQKREGRKGETMQEKGPDGLWQRE